VHSVALSPPPQLAVVVTDENKIEKPVTRKVRSVIRFLNAKNFLQAEIHRNFVEVYGDGALNEGNMRKWCRLFEEDRTNLLDEEGRAPLVTHDLKETVNARFLEKRQLTSNKLRNIFLADQSLGSDQKAEEMQGWLKGLTAIFLDEGI
jgi:hypothetical protein